MSPSASGRVLPCSAVSSAASSFMFSRISCWYLRKIRARVPIGVFFQVLKAFLALATAVSISAWVAKGTRARTSWVAGLITSRHSEVVDSTSLPSISSLTVAVAAVACVVMGLNLLRIVVMAPEGGGKTRIESSSAFLMNSMRRCASMLCIFAQESRNGLGQSAFFPRTVAGRQAHRGRAPPGRRSHHRGAAAAGVGEKHRRAIAGARDRRLSVDRGGTRSVAAGGSDGERLQGHREAPGRGGGQAVRQGTHRRHRGLRFDGPDLATGGTESPASAPRRRPAGCAACATALAPRSGHRDHPGTPRTRSVPDHPPDRLRAAPVRFA
ncbi:hypothetical protein D3C78_1128990 [compost metagenome]